MAKEKKNAGYPFPSYFGSHSSMVVKEAVEELESLYPHLVILEDEYGFYRTLKKRLDTGLADPQRYKEKRLASLLGGSKAENVDESKSEKAGKKSKKTQEESEQEKQIRRQKQLAELIAAKEDDVELAGRVG